MFFCELILNLFVNILQLIIQLQYIAYNILKAINNILASLCVDYFVFLFIRVELPQKHAII